MSTLDCHHFNSQSFPFFCQVSHFVPRQILRVKRLLSHINVFAKRLYRIYVLSKLVSLRSDCCFNENESIKPVNSAYYLTTTFVPLNSKTIKKNVSKVCHSERRVPIDGGTAQKKVNWRIKSDPINCKRCFTEDGNSTRNSPILPENWKISL